MSYVIADQERRHVVSQCAELVKAGNMELDDFLKIVEIILELGLKPPGPTAYEVTEQFFRPENHN